MKAERQIQKDILELKDAKKKAEISIDERINKIRGIKKHV